MHLGTLQRSLSPLRAICLFESLPMGSFPDSIMATISTAHLPAGLIMEAPQMDVKSLVSTSPTIRGIFVTTTRPEEASPHASG